MFYKKKGYPEIGEVVMCTVKRVLPHSVFVNLDEYEKEAMLHISEVSPGRIRNIRDYVKEGKKAICKILRINREKGYIDLSLRRVSPMQKINKNKEYKQEQKAGKILENISKELKIDLKQVHEEVLGKVLENYDSLNSAFLDVVNGSLKLEELNIKSDIAKKLTELVKEKIKIPEVSITGNFKLQNFQSEGIDVIKKILIKAKSIDKTSIKITYLGSSKYKLNIKSKDYKEAENLLKKVTEFKLDEIKKSKGVGEFIRND